MSELAPLNKELVYETAAILDASLKEQLDDAISLTFVPPGNNYLSLIRDRISYMMMNYELEDEDKEELEAVDNEALEAVVNAFTKEFSTIVDEDSLKEEAYRSKQSKGYYASMIYDLFYVGRSELVQSTLVNYILNRHRELIGRYKPTNYTKDDITFQAIQERYKFSNLDYAFTLFYISEIVNDLVDTFNDESFNMEYEFTCYPFNESETFFVEELSFKGSLVGKILEDAHKKRLINRLVNDVAEELSVHFKNIELNAH